MSICWSNHRIWDFSIIKSHLWLSQRITVVFIMCTNSSLKRFPNQATSYEIILVDMYPISVVLMTTDFCFLLIQDIEQNPKRTSARKCSCDPPHCLPSWYSNNHAASYFWQCISIYERLCPEDISEYSWHQSSEAQPNMSSPC